MNVPNKLTLTRCILTPVFFFFLLAYDWKYNYAVALLIFIVASLTDYFDGKIARKQGLVTNMGKFLDPLADKALTTAAFIGFVHLIKSSSLPWAVFLILAREFAVTSVRLLAAKDGVVVAASFAGKMKTVMQMVAIIYILAYKQAVRFDCVSNFLRSFRFMGGNGFLWASRIGMGFIWVATIATVVSGIQYIWQLRHYFKEDKA